MMNLIARTPSVVSSSTSVSPGKSYYGKQDPWSSVVADDRSGQPDKLSSTGYSKLDYDRAWSSQMFMAATMNEATFMGKNFQDNQNSIMNTTDLTLKKMFRHICKIGGRTR